MLQDMPQQREVLSLLTWVPIVAEKHPEKVKPLLVYMCLLIQEAQRLAKRLGELYLLVHGRNR